jgi:hypothetical protein
MSPITAEEIFYKGQGAGFGAGFDPKIEYIEESPAGDVSAAPRRRGAVVSIIR